MLSKFKRGFFYSIDTLTNAAVQSHNLNGIYFWLANFYPSSIKKVAPLWLLPLLPDMVVTLLGLKHLDYFSKLSELNTRITILTTDLEALLDATEIITHDSVISKLMQKKYMAIKQEQRALIDNIYHRINSASIAALQQFVTWVSNYLKYYSLQDGDNEANSFDNLMLYVMIGSSVLLGYSVASSPRYKVANLSNLDNLYQEWEERVLGKKPQELKITYVSQA